MKKRCGYSLAEAMVALSIVGFIALLAMPIIKSKMQDASNISKLQKVYKSLTDAVGSWMVDDRISEIRKTSYISAYPERFMPKYLRTMQESNTSTDGLLGKVYTDRNSHQFRIDFQDKYDCALLQNGSTLCLTPYNDDKYITRFGNSDVERIINHTSNVKHYDNAVSSVVKNEKYCSDYINRISGSFYGNAPDSCRTQEFVVRLNFEMCSAILSYGMTRDETLNYLNELQNTISAMSIKDFNREMLVHPDYRYADLGILGKDEFLYEMLYTAKNDNGIRDLLTNNPSFKLLYDRYEREGAEKFGLTCSGDPMHVGNNYDNGVVKRTGFKLTACNAQELYEFYQSPEFEKYYMYRYDNIKNNSGLKDVYCRGRVPCLDFQSEIENVESCSSHGVAVNQYLQTSFDSFLRRHAAAYDNFNYDTYSYFLSDDYENNVVEENKSWDEVIERKPTYVAPSESGKVNISQEQVHAHSSDKPIMEVVVDTNGASKPNKLGTDLFIFYIYPDGHVGVRSQDTSTNNCYMNQYYQCFKAVFNNDWKKPY